MLLKSTWGHIKKHSKFKYMLIHFSIFFFGFYNPMLLWALHLYALLPLCPFFNSSACSIICSLKLIPRIRSRALEKVRCGTSFLSPGQLPRRGTSCPEWPWAFCSAEVSQKDHGRQLLPTSVAVSLTLRLRFPALFHSRLTALGEGGQQLSCNSTWWGVIPATQPNLLVCSTC